MTIKTEFTESFAELFEQSLSNISLEAGKVIEAQVMDIKPGRIIVNANLKSDAFIPLEEFDGEELSIGDMVEVYIDSIENGYGETQLSRQKAKRVAAWTKLEKLKEENESVPGVITERVKGGFTVSLGSINAFLPGSLLDIKPLRDTSFLEGKDLEFKIIKMDQKRNNIVVSRRAVLEAESDVDRQARLEQLQEGQEIMGIVKNITDYGAFVDLGGADGLLHITDMAWKRVKHPSEVLAVGDEIKVKILKYDQEKNRVSLGLKQLGDDPWENISRRYPVGARTFGRITNVTDYGCFVEIEDGVEGLVHMSEMDWTNKNVHPSKVVQPNDEMEVMILEINEERRRISLGIKQCKANPWDEFSAKHQKGDKVTGKIRSITDFGMFVGLEGEIDGLIHLSDISWQEAGEVAVRNYKKGDELEAAILSIDPERERISLGIKQMTDDPNAKFLEANPVGETVTATVKAVEVKQATMELADGNTAIMRANDFHLERVEDLTTEIHEGEAFQVKILPVDKRTGELLVSHKATMKADLAKAKATTSVSTTLGDLLKDQMGGGDE